MTAATSIDLLVPLALLQPSTTNPRQRIDQEALHNLAESIAEHEVMSPILARPHPAPLPSGPTLEIVAGERRWRACGLLGERNPHHVVGGPEPVPAIPCLVRALTDAQVLAMQLVENIGREDLHPLEEAEHYRRMRDDAKAPATVEHIAHIAKVSVSRVYERLSLLHLEPAGREAFLANKLSLKTALLVARMPAEQQPEIARHLSEWGGEPMGPKAAAAFIRTTFMLRLATAPFAPADAELVPEAGSCGACPKRSGANPQLFADIGEEDTCTDRACFGAKRAAQRARLVDEMRITGYQVLEGEAARAACTPDGRALKPGLVSLEAQVPATLGDASLRVAEVLSRANVPNSEVQAIDHPLASTITLAVPEGNLEVALRRIKAHREQQRTPSLPPAAKAPAPSTPPAPPAVAKSAAQAAQRLAAAPADAFAGSEWPFPGTGQADEPTTLRNVWPKAETPRAILMFKLLAFEASARQYAKGGNLDRYRQRQERRASSILAAVLAAGAVTEHDGAHLDRHTLLRMLLVQLHYRLDDLDLEQACQLCGVDYEPAAGSARIGGAGHSNRFDAAERWLWTLPQPEAERLVAVLAAAQESGSSSGIFEELAFCVLRDLRVDATELEQRASESVALQLQLGAMKHGKPAAKPATKPSAKKSAGSTAKGAGKSTKAAAK